MKKIYRTKWTKELRTAKEKADTTACTLDYNFVVVDGGIIKTVRKGCFYAGCSCDFIDAHCGDKRHECVAEIASDMRKKDEEEVIKALKNTIYSQYVDEKRNLDLLRDIIQNQEKIYKNGCVIWYGLK